MEPPMTGNLVKRTLENKFSLNVNAQAFNRASKVLRILKNHLLVKISVKANVWSYESEMLDNSGAVSCCSSEPMNNSELLLQIGKL